jgi:hypothetical protein
MYRLHWFASVVFMVDLVYRGKAVDAHVKVMFDTADPVQNFTCALTIHCC